MTAENNKEQLKKVLDTEYTGLAKAQELTQQQNDERERLFNEFNQRFCVINLKGKPCVLEDFNKSPESYCFPSFSEWKTYHCNVRYSYYQDNDEGKPVKKTKAFASEWLESPSRREYADGIVFDPSNTHPPSQKNLWTGLGIKPREAVFPEKWLSFFLEDICAGDIELFNYLMDYYAHAVQKPWELPGIALVFRGNKGVGKGTAIKPLEHIFGSHFYRTQNKEHVLGRFNDITQYKLIIFLNETVWGGYKQMESILKGIITEPRKDIEKKGMPVYQVDNYSRVIIDSNDQWAVPVSTDERRYCFINVPDHSHKQDGPYFDAITYELEHGGAEGLLHELLKRDVENFRPMHLPAANTERGADMAMHSLSPVQDFLLGWLHDNCKLTDHVESGRVKRNSFYDHFAHYCRQRGINSIPGKVNFYTSVRACFDITERRTNGYDYFYYENVAVLREQFEKLVLKRKENWDAGYTPESAQKKALIEEVAE